MKQNQAIIRNEMKQNVIRNYKDTVFRRLFMAPEYALELYNALNGTAYSNPLE